MTSLDLTLLTRAVSPTAMARITAPTRPASAWADLVRAFADMTRDVTAFAAEASYSKPASCVDPVLLYDLPCSPESVARVEIPDWVWNRATSALPRLLEALPEVRSDPDKAAAWCIQVMTWLGLRLWATNVNSRFLVPANSPWIAASKPAQPPPEEDGVKCVVPTSWSDNCFRGERAWYNQRGPQEPYDQFSTAPYPTPRVDALRRTAQGATRRQVVLTYLYQAAQNWTTDKVIARVTRGNLAPFARHWKTDDGDPMPAGQLYPKGVSVGGDLAPRLAAIFARVAGPGHYVEANNSDYVVPTMVGQLAYCEALLRDTIEHDKRTPLGYFLDAAGYYVNNHLMWWSEAGMIDLSPADVQKLAAGITKAKVNAGVLRLTTIAGGVTTTMFATSAALGGMSTLAASGMGAAVAVAVMLTRLFYGKIIPRGGPGCPQPLVRRSLANAECTLDISTAGSGAATYERLVERGAFVPPGSREEAVTDEEPAGLHWGWKAAGGAAVVGLGILLIRKLLA